MFAATTLRRATRAVISSPSTTFSLLRTKTSLTPPNVASLKELGKLQSAYPQAHPELFGKMKSFYSAIPKGPAPGTQVNTFGQRYYQKYIEGDTFYPVLHFVGAMCAFGFVITYHAGGHYHHRFEFH